MSTARVRGWTTSAVDKIHNGELADLIAGGVRGITSNPTIFAKLVTGSHDYGEQMTSLLSSGADEGVAAFAHSFEQLLVAIRSQRPGTVPCTAVS